MANIYLDYEFTYDDSQYSGTCYCGLTDLPQEELSCAPYLFFALLNSGIPYPDMYQLLGKSQQELVDLGIWFDNAAVRLEADN